jgi:hypothetical protein
MPSVVASVGSVVEVGSCSCAAGSAVGVTAGVDVAAGAAPPGGENAAAGRGKRVGAALAAAFGKLSLEDGDGALERGELGVSDLDLDSELAKSSSCESLPLGTVNHPPASR